MQKTLTELPSEAAVTAARHQTGRSADAATASESISTLIEFPGARDIPEWRKRLSKRVRELQEQKARETAEAAAAIREAETVPCALPSGQLELVPEPEQAPLNPIVTKALERVDRARRAEGLSAGFRSAVAAPALAPTEEETQKPVEQFEPKPKLIIVSPLASAEPPTSSAEVEEHSVAITTEDAPDKPRRVGVISATVEEAALSYLETCLRLPAHTNELRKDVAGLTRRTFVGLIDLILIALMVSPALVVILNIAQWSDSRIWVLLTGIIVLTMFAYFTVAIALTGRTLGMRLLAVRAIDEKTGLIPTGGQSIKRAFGYIFSLSLFGLGLASALVDRDHRTLHDKLSKTIVVRA